MGDIHNPSCWLPRDTTVTSPPGTGLHLLRHLGLIPVRHPFFLSQTCIPCMGIWKMHFLWAGHFETPMQQNCIFDTPSYKNGIFENPNIQNLETLYSKKWHFRDLHLKKCVFEPPTKFIAFSRHPHTEKCVFGTPHTTFFRLSTPTHNIFTWGF